jgi:hypothetical protein
VFGDERGIALPLALIVLTLLTSLTLAFLGLSATEPMISTNLKRGEAALGLAEAGIERAIWALSNPKASGVANPAAAPYNGQQLLALGPGAYTIAISPGPTARDRILTAHGYLLRDGVAIPVSPANLVQADTTAHRVVRVQVKAGTGAGDGTDNTVGGPAMALPGAVTVAGTIELSGNSTVDGNNQAPGTPNGCTKKAGVTIRDKTRQANGSEIDNTITLKGSASAAGTPAQQEFDYEQFSPYTFSAGQLAALKALAQQTGTYIKPTSSSQIHLDMVDGLMFVDTVNGQALGTPPDPNLLASVKITGANNSGWLIVMGSIRIDGNVTYNGFVYAHNDLVYKGTGTGGIFGGVLTGNVVDSIATVVDGDLSGNSKIYFDCNKIKTGGGTFGQPVLDALDRVLVEITKGSWREVSN